MDVFLCFYDMPLRYHIISVILSVILVMQPLLPYVEYFTLKKYIIEHLCVNRDVPGSTCNGKCFLNKSLKDENNANHHENKVPSRIRTDITVYTIPENDLYSEEGHEIEKPGFFYSDSYSFTYYPAIFRPPRVS